MIHCKPQTHSNTIKYNSSTISKCQIPYFGCCLTCKLSWHSDGFTGKPRTHSNTISNKEQNTNKMKFVKITILLLIWSNTLNSGNDISRSITFRVYLKIESQPRLRECGDRISYAFLFLNELQEIWPFDAIWTESYVRVKYMGLLGIKV